MDFVEWLESELESRNWNRADLARKSGIYPSQITKVLNREANPGDNFINGVARAFGIGVDEVYRHAGKLPEVSKRDEYLKRIEHKLSKINDPDDRATIEGMIDLLSPDKKQKGTRRVTEQ